MTALFRSLLMCLLTITGLVDDDSGWMTSMLNVLNAEHHNSHGTGSNLYIAPGHAEVRSCDFEIS